MLNLLNHSSFMRKLLFSLAFLFATIPIFAQFSGSGSGTTSDPYLIYNESQLAQMANFLGQSKVFKLMKDLDVSNYISQNSPSEGWQPIGVQSSPFMGRLDGNGHTISGLFINRSSTDYVGFFGYLKFATINNLNINATYIKGHDNVGSIAGYSENSKISNCTVVITSTSGIAGNSNVGGIVGYAKTGSSSYNISNCNVTSTKINCGRITGGIVGYADDVPISSSTMKGKIDCGISGGGIVGYAKSSKYFKLESVTYFGDVYDLYRVAFINDETEKIGGIVGTLESSNSSTTITSAYSQGKITNRGNYTGGIIGYYSGIIGEMSNCYHFGDINGADFVGGVIGGNDNVDEQTPYYQLSTSSTSITNTTKYTSTTKQSVPFTSKINNCTAVGNISGNDYVGGIIGQEYPRKVYSYVSRDGGSVTIVNSSTYYYLYRNGILIENTSSKVYKPLDNYSYAYLDIINSYYSGTISGNNYVGGLAGSKTSSRITNCYSHATISGKENVGGLIGYADGKSEYLKLTVKSNVAINPSISATNNVGRIYGGSTTNVEIGALGSSQGNRALTQTVVTLNGVAQHLVDDLQNGTSIGPDMLKLKANYVSWGWDFNNNWKILETECYPYKLFQAAPPKIESNLVSQATSISGSSLDGGTVYLYYKNNTPVSTECSGNAWSFTTEPLESGALVQLYAETSNLRPSYFTSATVGYPGSGTEEDPYQIFTAADLQGATKAGYYKLMNDIDLTSWISANSSSKGWPAIGHNSSGATYIDGDGHKVTGLWINTTDSYNGLFSNFSNGYIKNLTVEVASGKKVKGGDYTGILIGHMSGGQIINCFVKGDIQGTINVGGLAGELSNVTLTNDKYFGSISSSTSNAYIGGLAGYHSGTTVTRCSATATISSTGSTSRVGGLFGYSTGGTLTKNYTDVTLNATGTYIGGLVGESISAIEECFATGTVTATGDNSYTGGLVGYSRKSVSNSYATANVTGTQFTAGLVGYTTSTINKCYAKGDINGVMYGAGVVGELDGSSARITNCVAVNNILSLTAQSSWGCRVIGGFKNGASEPNNSNYALSTMQVSLNGVPQTKTDDALEGIAKTQDILMTTNTYEGLGWDMNSVWNIDEGETYPYLLWEANLNPVVGITLDNTSIIIAVGNTATITANIQPQDATNKRLTWTSNNEAVATVVDGVVTAMGEGTATITAKSADGSNITASCQVTVVANNDEAIAQLQALVDQAQALYDNSTEGEDIGQYASGSRAALLEVINSVRAQISDMMDIETISECMTQLNDAITLFKSQQVSPGEDTDYSQIDNTLYIERTEASAGSQVQLSIKMKNTVDIQGYQFDLYLPEGVTVATDVEGFPMVELSTERTTARKTDYFDSSITPDGHLIVMCGSTKGYTFEGNDGEVALVTLDLADNMEEGEYAIIMRNVALTDPSATSYDTDYLKSTLEVFTYKLGDVNADTKINVADFIAVANHILGNTPPVFVYKAADVNLDTKINVADFIGIANMILSGTTSANNGSMMLAPKRTGNVTTTDIDELDNAIYIDPITVVPGTQQVLSVKMKNATEVAGFEFNLQLPEGISIAQEDGFDLVELSTERTTARKTNYFDYKMQNDGTLKVLCGTSAKNPDTGMLYTFEGNDGEVARITIDIPNDYEGGEYAIHVLNGFLADINAGEIDLETDIISMLTVEAGDGRIHFSETDTSLPSFTFGEKADVTVTRTINANEWSTICLPFGMTAEQIEDAFPETNVQLADFIGCSEPELDDEDEVMSFSFKFSTNVAEIEPNHPYLIKVDKKVESFEVDGVTLTPSDELSIDLDEIKWRQGGKWYYDYNSFIGTYEAQTEVPENCLFLNGNKFWYSTGATKMKAFRGYFYSYNVLGDAYKNGANSNVSLTFNDADGILSVKVGDLPTEGTYDLQGRKVVGSLKRGIYIVDGKKMVIK